MSLITDVIDCLNAEREKVDLPALSPNDKLMLTAQQHAEFMDRKQALSHSGAGGSTFDQRILATGYKFTAAAENVALGAVDAAGVVQMWMDSPPHRANILNAQVTEVGLGISPAQPEAPEVTRFWSLTLAAPL
ncbi:CAP domain-containing protein [Sneathiella sp. CAU 1612]|uniref:CAP domain-containing protein n=1 Tax=Sneathiella sedimenti TaxID=2816034 RepID=A0ABS3F7T5_9PROT|nr:CAP domain-containing protein [Sneathiella sedimenti]MBO0334403.1 CAP domain-containing protein [Sneathiella sedimenti]